MTFKTFGIASIAVALTACSSQPQQPAPSASPTASAPAAAAVASSNAKDRAPEVNRTLISAGYKPKVVNGEVFYCRTIDVTNTAFKKKVCLNEAQIQDEERRIKEMQRDIERMPAGACRGPECG